MKRRALCRGGWIVIAAASVVCVACGTDVEVGRLGDAAADGAGDGTPPVDGIHPPRDAGPDGPPGPCLDEQQRLKPGWCLIAGACYTAKERNPKANCLLCDPSLSATQWSGTDFDDQLDCFELPCIAQGRGCKAGHCMGQVTLTTPSDEACLMPDGTCYVAGVRSWTGCEICDPAQSKTSLSPAAHDCKIGDRCLVAGEKRSDSLWEPSDVGCAFCDPAQSTTAWSVAPGACYIGDKCYEVGAKDPTRCGVCAPDKNPSGWSPAPTGCSVGGQCFEPGEADATGCQVCDPAQSASAWSPRAHACEIDGACQQAGDRDGTGCASCDPSQSTTSWTVDAGVCLINGYCAKKGEAEPGGCAVCDPAQSVTEWTVTTGCLIDYACVAAGAPHWSGDCATCDPQQSKTSWTLAAGKCLIEDPYAGPQCRDPGTAHPGGDCAVCDPSQSQAAWTVAAGYCLIDNACVAAGDKDGTGCAICDPAQSQTSWTPATAGKCVIRETSDWRPPVTACYDDGAQHPYGDCAVCDTAKNPYAWTVVKGCLILDQCFAPGDKVRCGVCDPAQSTFDWTDVPGCELRAENDCVADGTQNDSATCAVCDTTQSTTGWTPTSGCYMAGVCYAAGAQLNPGSDCATCDPAKSKTSWTPGPGSCALSRWGSSFGDAQCYGAGATHPSGTCAICAPQQTQQEWTIVSGCLIDGQCFAAGDTCSGGPLLGSCNPGCWICDPARSQTSWSPALDRCRVAGACLADQEQLPPWDPCAVCDASATPSTMKILWGCLIGQECVPPGQPNYNDCRVCDPTRSTRAWSPPAGQCLIGDQCLTDGAKDQTGCLVCDASARPLGWSAVAGATSSAYSFDGGSLDGVMVSPKVGTVGWQLSTQRSADGTTALWFGDPATGSSVGPRHRATVTLPAATLVAGKPAALSFALWTSDPEPVLVLVDETVVWKYVPELGPPITFGQDRPWQLVTVDLSPYAGQSVVIRFAHRTRPAWLLFPSDNTAEGVYLDAIRVVSGCP